MYRAHGRFRAEQRGLKGLRVAKQVHGATSPPAIRSGRVSDFAPLQSRRSYQTRTIPVQKV
jgi:hypothetical protein